MPVLHEVLALAVTLGIGVFIQLPADFKYRLLYQTCLFCFAYLGFHPRGSPSCQPFERLFHFECCYVVRVHEVMLRVVHDALRAEPHLTILLPTEKLDQLSWVSVTSQLQKCNRYWAMGGYCASKRRSLL